jgi:hypothetical protein
VYQVSFRSDISFLRYCAETKKLTTGRPHNIHHIISRVRLRRNSAKNKSVTLGYDRGLMASKPVDKRYTLARNVKQHVIVLNNLLSFSK